MKKNNLIILILAQTILIKLGIIKKANKNRTILIKFYKFEENMNSKKLILKQIALVGNKNSLGNKISLVQSLTLGKANVSVSSVKLYLDELLKIPYFSKNDLLKTPFPKTVEKLAKDNYFRSSGNFEKELLWNSYFLKYLSEELTDFISIRDNFNRELLLGNLSDSRKILEVIEKKFGVSYWLLENKIFLFEVMDGIEKHKEFVNSIIKADHINNFLQYILSYVSIKMEENVTAEKYNLRISEVLQDLRTEGLPEDVVDYLKFKLYFKDNLISNPLAVLTFESNASIYDRYISFMKIQLCADMSQVSDGTLKEIKNDFQNIKDNFGVRTISQYTNHFDLLSVIDLYTMGDYEQTIKVCENLLNQYPYFIDIYPIYIKAVIRTPDYHFPFAKKSILYILLTSLENLYLSNNKFSEAYSQIKKYTYIFSSNLWSISLRGLLEEIAAQKKYAENYIHQYKKNVDPNNPLFISDNSINRFDELEFNKLLKLNPSNNTLKLYKSIYNNDINLLKQLPIPDIRKKSKMALILYNSGKFKQAKVIYKDFLECADPLYKIEGIIGFVNCCIELSNYRECITLIVDLFLNENLFIQQLDYTRLLKKIQNAETEIDNLFDYIETPILFDIYSRMFNDDKESEKSEAYEEFLFSNDYEKPSQIDWENSKFSLEKLSYFFKFICIESVMDYSPSFESTEEVEQERILICQKMREIDPENSKTYAEEIREITQKQIINRNLRKIQQSKIYVDVNGIKASLEKETKENMDRYKSLFKVKRNNEEASYVNLSESIDEFSGVTIQLSIPTDERRQLLYRIIFDIRDSFVSSNKFGLDGYLSVGIRHGTLAGQLRAPLEEQELLTKKDIETGRYQLSKYWENRELNDDIKAKIIDSFDKFGTQIDSYIDTLKNKWVQIKTEEETSNSEGLFNFQVYLEELEEIDNKVDLNTTYDDIFDLITQMLWKKTDDSLNNLRNKITGELTEKFDDSFNVLLQEISSLQESIDVTEIKQRIINSKTNMQYELNQVSEWFTRNSNSYNDSYTTDLLIDIAYELVKKINNKEVLLDKKVENITLRGNTLKSFVDILFILFDNITKHSNIENTVPVSIELYEKNQVLYLKCENDIAPGIITDEKRHAIKMYQEKIEKQDDLEFVSREGGSGFYKIHKIVDVDLKCELKMNFGYHEDQNKFYVVLEINPLRRIIVEDISN